MDSITHATESLAALSTFLEVMFALLGTTLAVSMGAVMAWKLAPFEPSDSPTAVAHLRYLDTQARLVHVRARRLSNTTSSDVITRDARVNDDTLTDLTLTETFSVVAIKPIEVSNVRELPSYVVG